MVDWMNIPEVDDAQLDEVMIEREQMTVDALLKCKRYGVPPDTLLWLAFEAGAAAAWNAALKQRGWK